jgi:hypothetical protein
LPTATAAAAAAVIAAAAGPSVVAAAAAATGSAVVAATPAASVTRSVAARPRRTTPSVGGGTAVARTTRPTWPGRRARAPVLSDVDPDRPAVNAAARHPLQRRLGGLGGAEPHEAVAFASPSVPIQDHAGLEDVSERSERGMQACVARLRRQPTYEQLRRHPSCPGSRWPDKDRLKLIVHHSGRRAQDPSCGSWALGLTLRVGGAMVRLGVDDGLTAAKASRRRIVVIRRRPGRQRRACPSRR